ncbi:MAG: phospho-N-acetylmuramoyl-pentapeptide-transferase [Nitrospirae bacterium CG_4_9_14_3_um_filter_53_35]|nr:MAG: phospho-N-acetylmuramoyl-pentapeptide-transferase [Nitrospirae bacterium CG2_30_53_67]PIS37084.1 MAG: phospho-N-acetylmuramoyl-pentapeptide-transferase [Nitrospirae bacterium CG08_land_8_20_14_0_20_52_24]PIV82902.1 MAG: phospho-N-acetylmuramoyl-pentapeptide-transferase [Nitrospirae bacterium CG17_big_fil_post_rev_8_21_14_2_50_50_9]PIW84268.1 MAG: phospho-N-acetylmuramoyl-pentapeptide-transferase [Nitrospirae bacterium CG_4_8_14_3_um_filter_50_41]PIX85312.1 MAG: phospho-N-acetylmuramoyl-
MLYHLLYPLHETYKFFNVFRYITFRTVVAALTSLLISLVVGPYLIRWLTQYHVGQRIRKLGPQNHQKKAGTPTMGGVLILLSLFVSIILWADLTNRYVWLVLLATLGFGLIGFLDDYLKLIRNRSEGLRPKQKFFFQVLLALVIGLVLILYPEDSITTSLPLPFFKKAMPDLGWFYLPFAMLVIVGTSNAVNLTDGLDGLAIGPVMISSMVYAVIVYATGNVKFAGYLQIPYVKGVGELTLVCFGMVGASLGFLWFNTYPASVFMGDIGSLALGGALGTVAVISKHEILLVLIGGIFVIEAMSVILQVASFKLFGKRLFRMAPIHHHYELKGWAEPKIIVRFWIISIILALMALGTLKLR